MNRREFLVLAASAGAVAGCRMPDAGGPSAKPLVQRVVNAGPISRYSADGVYGDFRELGFFIVRKGVKLGALSALCTHRKCRLSAEADLSFYCKCHGSTFDPEGKVTAGPAQRDLPNLPASVDEDGRLLVTVPAGAS